MSLRRLRDNKTSLWFWKVVFSSKFRCRELTKPTEVFIDEVKSNYVELKSTKDPERGFFIRVFIVTIATLKKVVLLPYMVSVNLKKSVWMNITHHLWIR